MSTLRDIRALYTLNKKLWEYRMSDIALFPVPLPVSSEQLAEEYSAYISNEVSLGIDTSGNILSVSDNSVNNCMQRALKVILTEKGSVPTRVNDGTILISLLKYGYNPATINEDIVMVLLDAETQCKKQDIDANVPVSAQLGSIELLNLVLLANGILRISIGVKTVEGLAGRFDLQA